MAGYINLLAILIAVVVYMILGFLWYSPVFFGKTWMKFVGKKPKDLKKNLSTAYIGSLISAIVMALILTAFINFAGAAGIGGGALVGLLAWLGFVASTNLVNSIFSDRPAQLYFIDMGYHLISLIIMGGIIGAFA